MYAYTCWNEDIVMLNNLKICQSYSAVVPE